MSYGSTPSEYANGLRQLASFVEAHPDLFRHACTIDLNLFANDRESFADKARQLGSAKKQEQGHWYFLCRKFGPHSVNLNIEREQVCTKVKTGTKTVSKPDPAAVEALPLVDVEEPVYEWSCPESVLRLEDK